MRRILASMCMSFAAFGTCLLSLWVAWDHYLMHDISGCGIILIAGLCCISSGLITVWRS